MSSVIIDNSSISAMQRIFGMAPCRNDHSTDGDIAALEGLLSAYLFNDETYVVDDYKAQYSTQRKNQFPQFKFIEPSDQLIEYIDKKTKNEFQKDILKIRAGEFSGFGADDFFNALGMHMTCTWDVSSSVYYLTLKLLGSPEDGEFSKYSALTREILKSLSDKYESHVSGVPAVTELIDSKGTRIRDGYVIPWAKESGGETGGLSPGMKTFLSALSWSSYRTLYYNELAKYFWADLSLHPIRQVYLASHSATRLKKGNRVISEILNRMTRDASEVMGEQMWLGGGAVISASMPLFSLYCIEKCDRPNLLMQAASDLRNADAFIQARGQLKEIRNAVDENKGGESIKKLDAMMLEFGKTMGDIRSKYGRGDKQGIALSKIIFGINWCTEKFGIPAIPDEIVPNVKVPNPLQKEKGISSVFRSIITDLGNIEKIGKYHDRLTSMVTVDRDLPVFSLKCEEGRYRKANSTWKSHM